MIDQGYNQSYGNPGAALNRNNNPSLSETERLLLDKIDRLEKRLEMMEENITKLIMNSGTKSYL